MAVERFVVRSSDGVEISVQKAGSVRRYCSFTGPF